jgi:hypothetical protein
VLYFGWYDTDEHPYGKKTVSMGIINKNFQMKTTKFGQILNEILK